MSRYTLTGKEPRYRIVVGWDPSLQSFFGQVLDLAFESGGKVVDQDAIIGDSPDEGLLVWVGADEVLSDVTQIVQALADFGTLPAALITQLHQDQQANTPFTKAHVPPEIVRAAAKRYRALQRAKGDQS